MAKVFTITEGLENMGALKTGGQGSVYKAKRIGEIITAVKLLPTPIHVESMTDKHYIDFQNEVAKLKKVNQNPNPNVVKIVSSGITETGSFPYIEMEFIEGPDLEELLKSTHPPVFTIKEAIKVAEQLSHALSHCHSVEVKHGDIKSNNVKFNRNTGNYVLLDFGLALMSDEQRRTSLRHAGAIEFMAPEQNEGKMLFQTDVYSFGIIIFELLAGVVPFPLHDQGETARNLVRIAHMEAPVPDLVELRHEHLPEAWSKEKKDYEIHIPQWLLKTIRTCLEKDPGKRFANGIELHQFIVKNSIQTNQNEIENAEKVKSLYIENEKLLQENNELKRMLANYQSKTIKGNEHSPNPKKSRIRSGLIAAFLTLLVIFPIAYYALKSRKSQSKELSESTSNKPDQPRQVIGQYKVMAQRAYFYNSPDQAAKRSAYMIPSNDVIGALEEKNGFIYTEFTNSKGQTSKGWLRKQDLVTLDEWTQNNQAKEQAKPADQDIDTQLKTARNYLDNNHVKEALYIYSYLSGQQVPEAMYEYGNLALQNKNNDLSCAEALDLVSKSADMGYAAAKRTLGFLYIFAENKDVLQISNYDRCSFDKNVYKGTQLLIQAVTGGDTTAKRILEDINARRAQEDTNAQ